jgi:[ribosomal protein S5]-alanine N-acetyltransferase
MKISVTDQIYLTEIQSSDKAALVEHLAEKEIYDRTLRIPYPYTEAEADKWLAIVAESTKLHGQPTSWAIRETNGSLIGCIGYEGVEIGKSHRAEIGYWIAKPFWGRGIMTAVVERACSFGFSEFRLTKIVAHTFAANDASSRVLEKCGFQLEGYLRKHFMKDGQLIDANIYGLLK